MAKGRFNTTIKVGDRFGSVLVLERCGGPHPNIQVLCDCGLMYLTYSYRLKPGTETQCMSCTNLLRAGRPNKKNRIDPLERTVNDLWNSFRKQARKHSDSYISKREWRKLSESNCVFCGAPPSNVRKAAESHAQDFVYNGIDRIDSKQGYTSENVQPCCWPCNRMKGNLSQEEFIAHVKRICVMMSL